MTQEQALILAFKVVLLAGEVGAVLFIAMYTRYAKWWKNVISLSIVYLDALLFAAFLPSTLSLFFSFSRLDSEVAGWLDVSIFGFIALNLFWRSYVWHRIHKD